MSVYPNPVHGSFTLNYDLGNGSGNGEVIVYNTLGAVVLRQHLNSGDKSTKVESGSWAHGIYFLSVERNGVRVGSGKVVVRQAH